ncbi:MAG: MliC family protein [Pseudotabrizicola sp.]|uniref:MliC family protein n=1 Tax=Pseudotabrizicola sp. TaxID=2939647 RepID=UPI0027319366|nr:MliC family protein [Pseudotabrizicola sp.]MDP2083175.1 MliC family protein [Pseudotabrizicola sp.]MDZ7572592.1 MliC family protein [Pseudotabrizicola sp.]
MRSLFAVGLIALADQAGAAPLDVQNLRFKCDRDVEVPVVFVTGPEDAVAVVQIDGGQFLLYREPAASGAKYSWPSDGASYVLWSKGNEATIYWREAGKESPLLTCVVQMQ